MPLEPPNTTLSLDMAATEWGNVSEVAKDLLSDVAMHQTFYHFWNNWEQFQQTYTS